MADMRYKIGEIVTVGDNLFGIILSGNRVLTIPKYPYYLGDPEIVSITSTTDIFPIKHVETFVNELDHPLRLALKVALTLAGKDARWINSQPLVSGYRSEHKE